jgi:hypothetical protein
VRDQQCERNGSCIAPDAATWRGGYCTKFGCDIPGNPCAGGGRCQERRIGVSICVESCTVAGGRGTTPAEWIVDRGGCRLGYQCVWNGIDGALVAGNGACIPGNFNPITAGNVGATCTTDSGCYSPFGYGVCGDTGLGRFCTALDCGAPGVPAGVCGAGASCVDADGADGDLTLCVENCTGDGDCTPGFTCMDHDAVAGTPRVCFATP